MTSDLIIGAGDGYASAHYEKEEIYRYVDRDGTLGVAQTDSGGHSARQKALPDFEMLQEEVEAWQERRNIKGGKIDWRFTTEDVRIKLKRLYPSIDE